MGKVMFRDGTMEGSLSSPLLHPPSSVPTDAAILQFDSSSPQSILDSSFWMQCCVHVITVCRTCRGCITSRVCVCVCVCVCMHVCVSIIYERGNESVKSTTTHTIRCSVLTTGFTRHWMWMCSGRCTNPTEPGSAGTGISGQNLWPDSSTGTL